MEVQLFSSLNEYEINQVCAILTQNDIPFIRKDEGSGSYMSLYMGQSIQEKRIFVSKDDYDKAIDLISSLMPNEIEIEEVKEDEEMEEDESHQKHVLIRRGLGFFILGFPIILIVLVVLVLFIQGNI